MWNLSKYAKILLARNVAACFGVNFRFVVGNIKKGLHPVVYFRVPLFYGYPHEPALNDINELL